MSDVGGQVSLVKFTAFLFSEKFNGASRGQGAVYRTCVQKDLISVKSSIVLLHFDIALPNVSHHKLHTLTRLNSAVWLGQSVLDLTPSLPAIEWETLADAVAIKVSRK